MLMIYHAPGTRSVRPIWLCHELGLPIEVETIEFSPAYLNSPQWRAISPAGKLPIMTDGALTMFESGAMVDYILERYGQGRLQPSPGTLESAQYRQWCWFSEATLIRPLGLAWMFKPVTQDLASFAGDAKGKVADCLATVESALAGKDYLLGAEFTAADIMMGYALILLERFKVLDTRYPNAMAYVARLKSRDACRRALSA